MLKSFKSYLLLGIKLFQIFFQLLKYLNKCAHGTARKSSSNPVKSKSINQSKICSKFQRCIWNPFENLLKILAFLRWIAKKAPTYMFDWVLNTYIPEVDNIDTRTTSFMLFMCFYCLLWTNLVHWLSCIFDIFRKLTFPLFWTIKQHLEKILKIEKSKWHNASQITEMIQE